MSLQYILERPRWYLVQISRRDVGQIRRQFAFSTHGSKENALRAAQAARDEILASLPAPHAGPAGIAQRSPRASNTTGVTGVTLATRNGQAFAWRASWQEGPRGARKRKSKDFAFHSEAEAERARERAIRHRRRMEREHYENILE